MNADALAPERCELRHHAFACLGEVMFRRSPADGTPVVVVDLGSREAAVPLRALQREWSIADESADGRMLGLIVQALDYVPALRLGDALPAEILTGQASWEPGPEHRRRALAGLRAGLLAWLGAETGDPTLARESVTPERIEREPRLRAALGDAFGRAAGILGLPDREALVGLLQEIGGELAYVESLRDSLFARACAMLESIEVLRAVRWRGDAARMDALGQVERLARIAIDQIGQRFAEVDAQTGEVIATLRNVEAQRVFIRGYRDWLHRSRLAWEPTLLAWDSKPRRLDDATWTLIGHTYQFLAQRFMPVQEWQPSNAVRGARAAKPEAAMLW